MKLNAPLSLSPWLMPALMSVRASSAQLNLSWPPVAMMNSWLAISQGRGSR